MDFLVVGCNPFAEMVCPKYSTSCNIKWHFSSFNFIPAAESLWSNVAKFFRCSWSVCPVIKRSSRYTQTPSKPWRWWCSRYPKRKAVVLNKSLGILGHNMGSLLSWLAWWVGSSKGNLLLHTQAIYPFFPRLQHSAVLNLQSAALCFSPQQWQFLFCCIWFTTETDD